MAWSPDGKRLAASNVGPIRRRCGTLPAGRNCSTLKGHRTCVERGLEPGRQAAGHCEWDETVEVWDAASGQELLTLKGHTGSVTSVAWGPDGKRLATGSWDRTAKVWDTASGQELLTLRRARATL